MDKEIIYDKLSEEYNAIKWLENKTTNYSDDDLTLHYNLILYNLIINLQQRLKKKDEVIDRLANIIYEIDDCRKSAGGYPSDYIDKLVCILNDDKEVR